jgi:hypothetical protein
LDFSEFFPAQMGGMPEKNADPNITRFLAQVGTPIAFFLKMSAIRRRNRLFAGKPAVCCIFTTG